MARLDKWESKHLKDVERYARQIEAIYQSAVREAAAIGATIPNFNPNKPFSFANYPSTKARIEKLLQTLKTGISTVILNGIEAEWTLANNKNNELCNVVFGEYATKLSPEQARKYYNTNDKACKAFTERKIGGLKLSDRVWRYTEQFKTEIEMGIDLGLRDGLSADEMSRTLRQYLQHPDKPPCTRPARATAPVATGGGVSSRPRSLSLVVQERPPFGCHRNEHRLPYIGLHTLAATRFCGRHRNQVIE